MQIFKFGGASVKDAAGVRNVAKILEKVGYAHSLIVISAMGKTTNALEVVVNNYFKAPAQLPESLQTIKDFHYQIIRELFSDENHPVYWKVDGLFAELSSFLERNKSPKHSFVYDQVIGFGELLSTTIISQYLNDNGIKNNWIDVRNLIKTDSNYRDAGINWEETQTNISNNINKSLLNITQLFWVAMLTFHHYSWPRRLRLYGGYLCLLLGCQERNDLERRTGGTQCRPSLFPAYPVVAQNTLPRGDRVSVLWRISHSPQNATTTPAERNTTIRALICKSYRRRQCGVQCSQLRT